MSASFKIGDHEYRASKLNAFEQLHIARTFAPALIRLSVLKGDAAGDPEKLVSAAVISSQGIGAEDFESILRTCLTRASRKEGPAWAAVMAQGQIMFQDIDGKTAMLIALKVMEESGIVDFFGAPLSTLPEAGEGDAPSN